MREDNGVSACHLGLAIETTKQETARPAPLSLEGFLASVQRRAFAMATTATGDREDALDVVQDAMMQLVKRYSDRTPDEWRMLFYRILHNRINDLYRRRKVRNRVKGWLPGQFRGHEDADQEDPFQAVPGVATDEPENHLVREQNIHHIQLAVTALPRRQREAFMLRCWEGLSTAETAATMQCSEGSVKTHYSRAMISLKAQLEEHRP